MIKTFEIVAKFDIPEELKNKYVGDEAVCEDLKEILLEEIGEEIKPEIIVNVLDSESVVKVKLNSLYGKTAMNGLSEIRKYKINKLQEWVEAEISELKEVMDSSWDCQEAINNQLAVYQKVLNKIKEYEKWN